MRTLIKYITIFFLSLPILINAQGLSFDSWEKVETEDEFGDKTGEFITRTFGKGTFSNSATTGEDLIVRYSDYQEFSLMSLYEYASASNVARMGLAANFGIIKVKLPSGEVLSFDTFAPKDGGLYFSKENYKKFSELMLDGKGQTIKVLVQESSFSKDYGRSKYNFTLTTMSAEEKTKFGM